MTVAQMLEEVRAKVTVGHCKGQFAEDLNGNAVGVTDKKAARWCLLGALYATSNELARDPDYKGVAWRLELKAFDCLRRAFDANNPQDIVGHGRFISFNDRPETTQQDVIGLVNRAIEIANAPD